jgi:hypothetical protein
MDHPATWLSVSASIGAAVGWRLHTHSDPVTRYLVLDLLQLFRELGERRLKITSEALGRIGELASPATRPAGMTSQDCLAAISRCVQEVPGLELGDAVGVAPPVVNIDPGWFGEEQIREMRAFFQEPVGWAKILAPFVTFERRVPDEQVAAIKQRWAELRRQGTE